MMNTLLAKALMLPLTGIPEPLEDMHEINREVQLIECQIQRQNASVACIERHISCMPVRQQPRSSAKYPYPVESSDD
jgi:hypothetical protein